MKRYLLLIIMLVSAALFFSCEEPEPIDEGTTVFKVDKTLVKFSMDAGSGIITLTTDALSWTAVAGDGWVTIDPVAGSGDALITVSVPVNDGARRLSSITFSTEGMKDIVVSVVQEEKEKPAEKIGLYTQPEELDADSPCTLYYRAPNGSSLYGVKELYAHIGINEWENVQADWGTNTDRCKFQPTDDPDVYKLEITPTIRQWFGVGESEIFRIAVVVRNYSGSEQSSDLFIPVKDSKYAYVPDPVVEEALPAGALHGINYNSDGSVTFVLYEKDRKGDRYDWCYLIGEFNGWERKSEYAMKRDETAGCWWITCSGFEADKEYMFQYMIGDDNTRLCLSDPYSEITYSGDDQWIASSTYPGLKAYPSQTSGYVSAFEIGRDTSFSWADFEVEDEDDLIIYELLLRDFTVNGSKEGNLALAMEKLDYLETLGVNAIELMPIQEFDGNDSWGYNPNHYFALDKAYGTREMYKEFINECHKRGIAVIVDVVYNHLTGNNAFNKMYLLGMNPFFNETAPHPYSVFEDINHENEVMVNYIKRSLGYLLTEYNVDGFRFDLTKGFTNKQSTEGTASNYDASRVAILKGYNDYIRSVDPETVVILEHFCDDREEKELAEAGMKVWRNLNYAYGQAAQGTKKDSGFAGLWTGGNEMPFGAYVGFMESHDEERNAYRQKAYGAEGVKGDLAVMMQRLELNAAFFFTVPGPKMIWQFGELGYDVSIENGGRTGKKAPRWDYLDVPERKALYDTYCGLIRFRRDNPEFFGKSASFSWSVEDDDWDNGRFITCTAGGKSFVVVGNFTTESRTITAKMPSAGTWINHFDAEETFMGSDLIMELPAGEFKLLTNF